MPAPSRRWVARNPALGCAAVAAGLLLVPTATRGQSPSPKPAPSEDARDPQQLFEQGVRAFKAGDYVRAAQAFDSAYGLAPHPDVLWNAARSWHRAGESVRAANLYARYLHDAAPDAKDRDSATAALAELSKGLGRIDVVAPATWEIRVDGVIPLGPSTYVAPGSHVVTAHSAEGDLSRSTTVEAGAAVSVAFPSSAAPPPPPTPQPSATAPVTPDGGGKRGWPPAVVAVEAALVGVAAGLSVWSGVDTLSARSAYLDDPNAQTQEKYDDGRAKQTRTNVLFGVTGGLALVTLATAIWLVDWHGSNSRGRAGYGCAATCGRF